MCRASGRGCTVIPWHPAAIHVRAASTTSGIFPPRAFLSVAILLTLTLSRTISAQGYQSATAYSPALPLSLPGRGLKVRDLVQRTILFARDSRFFLCSERARVY